MQRDTLTPLDADNTLLFSKAENGTNTTFSMANAVPDGKDSYSRSSSPDRYPEKSSMDPANPYSGDRDNLISNAAPIGQEPAYSNNGGYGGNDGGGYYQQQPSGGYYNQGAPGYAPYRGY